MRQALALLLGLLTISGCAGSSKDWPRNCPVHHQSLRSDTVPIGYGLPDFFQIPEWRDAIDNQFPYANTVVHGGCVSTDKSPRRAQTKYCRACRQAEARWTREDFPAIKAKYYTGKSER